MTNEDAIKWLGNLKNDIGNLRHESLWHYAQAIDEITELLEEQEKEIEKLQDRLQHAVEVGELFFEEWKIKQQTSDAVHDTAKQVSRRIE